MHLVSDLVHYGCSGNIKCLFILFKNEMIYSGNIIMSTYNKKFIVMTV